ncbi:polysaccharide deacetylase family protein [soil metagenome]
MIYFNPWLGCASLLAGSAGTLAYGISHPSSQIFGRSVYRGAGARRSIALTFDDGPSEGSLRLLDYLAQQDVVATFFQCGTNVLRHPEIARQINKAGHEIGNHTFSHARLCPRIGWKMNFRSMESVYSEFSEAQRIIVEEVGVRPSLLRAPYGLRWFGVGSAQKRLDLLGVMWTVIGHDWEWKAPDIARLVLAKADPGGIICLHDGRDISRSPDLSEMLASLPEIIPRLKDDGYSFETVSQLLQADPHVCKV